MKSHHVALEKYFSKLLTVLSVGQNQVFAIATRIFTENTFYVIDKNCFFDKKIKTNRFTDLIHYSTAARIQLKSQTSNATGRHQAA